MTPKRKTTIGQDLRKLGKFKRLLALASARKTLAEVEMKRWQEHCFARMVAEDCEGHRTAGQLFTPSSKEYATIQDLGEFLRWAEIHQPDLVKEVPREAELNALVRAAHDDGAILPPGVGFYTRDIISVRKS